jgi:hypothetical protein
VLPFCIRPTVNTVGAAPLKTSQFVLLVHQSHL